MVSGIKANYIKGMRETTITMNLIKLVSGSKTNYIKSMRKTTSNWNQVEEEIDFECKLFPLFYIFIKTLGIKKIEHLHSLHNFHSFKVIIKKTTLPTILKPANMFGIK